MPDDRSYVLISPCRNEADYMRRTLDSVVAQTLTPTLWVIVDDGSTDETPQILADSATTASTRASSPIPASSTSIWICRRATSRR